MLRAAPHFGMEPAALRMLVEAPPAAGSGDVAAPAPGCCESEPMVLVWGGGLAWTNPTKRPRVAFSQQQAVLKF